MFEVFKMTKLKSEKYKGFTVKFSKFVMSRTASNKLVYGVRYSISKGTKLISEGSSSTKEKAFSDARNTIDAVTKTNVKEVVYYVAKYKGHSGLHYYFSTDKKDLGTINAKYTALSLREWSKFMLDYYNIKVKIVEVKKR